MKPEMIDTLASCGKKLRLLLDSGAFTAWKAGKPIALDDYCRFLDSLKIKPWRYFMLDVIGDPHATMRNYETMLKRGYDPIPIFTRGEDPSVLEDYYKTSDVVGIGGLVGTPANKGFVKGIMQTIGNRKVHWLGFTSQPFIAQYRPFSCDSSSWQAAFMYGRVSLYLDRGKWINFSRADFSDPLKRNKLGQYLSRFGVSPEEMASSKSWVTSGSVKDPSLRITMPSYIRFTHDVEEKFGTKYFLAITGAHFLKSFNYFYEEME